MPKTILQRMDDGLRWTGMPRLVENDLRPDKAAPVLRRSRWLPLALLIVATLLVIRYAANPALFASHDRAEIVIRTVALLLPCMATVSSFFGPLNPRRRSEQVDEWEDRLRHRAMVFSVFFIGGLELAGVPIFIAVAFINRWSSPTILVEIGLWFTYLFVAFQLAATLHASWSMSAAASPDA